MVSTPSCWSVRIVSGISLTPALVRTTAALGGGRVPPRALPSLEVRLPLLQERVDALGVVLCGKEQIEALALVVQPGFQMSIAGLQRSEEHTSELQSPVHLV